MKFDYIIIGGGLCGLSAGIKLAAKGHKTAIISSGQSALHFCAGSLGLLGKHDDMTLDDPCKAIASLPETHPYRRLGAEKVKNLAAEAATLLGEAGIKTHGDTSKNHFTLTPFGLTRPSWLTVDGYAAFDNATEKPFESVLIVALKGFLESYPSFMAENLEKAGVKCRIETIDLSRLERLRKSNFDMRAVSVAKQMDEKTIEEFASKINSIASKEETVLIPAVVGINSAEPLERLRSMVRNELYCVPTVPVSVAGVRMQNTLLRHFEKLGGTYLLGDHVDRGIIENGEVKELITTNFGDDHLSARAYILASGSLFSEGIVAKPSGFYEPVFGLDVDFAPERKDWYNKDFFAAQPYMEYGVSTDADFHPAVEGKKISNLYAAGALLAGCNSLKEDSGAGVAMLTGLHVADSATNL